MIEYLLHNGGARWGDFAGDHRHGSNLSRPFFSESKMAAVASESEQVVDQANEGVLAEQKPVDEKITEEEPKEGGAFFHLRIFVASLWSSYIFRCVWKSVN